MPVSTTNKVAAAKKKRRLKLTADKAAAILAKKKEFDERREAEKKLWRKSAKRPQSKAADVPTPLPEPLHPVAVAVLESVAEKHIEELLIYEPAEAPAVPVAEKTWVQSLREYWEMIKKW